MNYGSKLRIIRKRQKIGTDLLADRSGVSNATISRIERNKYSPKVSTLLKLAKGLNISKDKMLSIAGMVPKIPGNIIKPKGYIKVPVVGSIPCGDPNTALRETNDYKLVPVDEDTEGMFFLRADGHSMEPDIKDKSLVKIHKQNTIENGEIAAVSINGEDATLKKVVMNDSGKIVLFHPLNPRFSDIFPSPDNRYKLIGKAVSVLNPL